MRRVLVDRARAKLAGKRGGGQQVQLADWPAPCRTTACWPSMTCSAAWRKPTPTTPGSSN